MVERDAGRGLLAGVSAVFFAWLVVLVLFASTAAADPGPEFIVPDERASEPALPALAECPVAAPDEIYEAEDDLAARQVALLRQELVAAISASCEADADRQEQVIHRLWWIVTQLLGQQDEAVGAGEWLAQIAEGDDERGADIKAVRAALEEGVLRTTLDGVDGENPLPVVGEISGGEGGDPAELIAAIDSAGEANVAAVYVVAGLLVALFMGAAFQRLVDRGT